MEPLVLITSAAPVAPELAAEFGPLPPALLPVGHGRLIRLQVDRLRPLLAEGGRLVLTLPDSFQLTAHDARDLAELGVAPLGVVTGLSLGESVVCALNLLGVGDRPLRLLHGDTLIDDLPTGDDLYTVHPATTRYAWAAPRFWPGGRTALRPLAEDDAGGAVVSGYFSFASSQELVRGITRARGDFIAGLNRYGEVRPLSAWNAAGRWLDFGHLQTYYQSRGRFGTQRAFNALATDDLMVTKTSGDGAKMAAEAGWFEALPADLRVFTPAFCGRCADGYRLGHEYLSTLRDLHVFGELPPAGWARIFRACGRFLDACAGHRPADPTLAGRVMALYRDKPRARIAEFCRAAGLDPDAEWRINGRPVPGLATMVADLGARIPPPPPAALGVMHGDLCFSNIFFDFRRDAVKVIDPRGHLGDGTPEIFGDLRYDLAKLAHSVLGRYDFILAGAFDCRREGATSLTLDLPDDPRLDGIAAAFRAHRFAGLAPEDPAIRAATALLFLSMLPLHADRPDRQWALLANGLRLYRDLEDRT